MYLFNYKIVLKVQIKNKKAYPAQYTGVSTITDVKSPKNASRARYVATFNIRQF